MLDLSLLPKLPGTSIIADHMIDKVTNIHGEVKKPRYEKVVSLRGRSEGGLRIHGLCAVYAYYKVLN